MKKSLLLGLGAIAMGFVAAAWSVASSTVSDRLLIETKAGENDITVYCAIDSSVVKSYQVRANFNYKGDGEEWGYVVMTDTPYIYQEKTVYSATIDAKYGGLGALQFQIYDGGVQKYSDQVFGIREWTLKSAIDNKLHSWYKPGLFDYNLAPSDEEAINLWANEFLDQTGSICGVGTVDDDHSAELAKVWQPNDGTISDRYFLKGSFDDWGAGVALKQVGDTNVYRINKYMIAWQSFKINDVTNDGWYPEENQTIGWSGYYNIEFNADDKSVTYYEECCLSTSFNALPPTAQDLFLGNSEDADVRAAFKRFTHIVTRYGFTNFTGAELSGLKSIPSAIDNHDNGIGLTVVITSLVAILSLSGYFFIQKKKLSGK